MADILVVDDLSANRDVIVTLLRYQGHTPHQASDGAEALRLVRAKRPDLVITDVLMPVMDGYELVRELRSDPATADIPVVFYTAHYAERDARELARAGGVAAVLTKPVEPENVLAIVHRVLEGKGGGAPTPARLPSEFDREHLRLVTDKLSEQERSLRRANGRLNALINIGIDLASERNTDRLLRTVCTSARELFGATYVTLGLVDQQHRVLSQPVACGVGALAWAVPGSAAPGVIGVAVRERRVVQGHNPDGDPRVFQLPETHPPAQALLVAPIVSPTYVYGWLCLVGNEGRTFSDEDEPLLLALCGQVGRIYENGYFYAVAQTRARELEQEVFDRRRAEVALQTERNRAQRYLDTAEVVLLALDLEGRVTLMNRYGCELLGWTAAELLGRNWIDTCVPVSARIAARRMLETTISESTVVLDHPIVGKTGETRLLEWRSTVVRNDSGEAVGTFSSGTDVTARERAVAALREAEERMRFALDNANLGIWDMDYRTGRLTWSETAERHYGFAPGVFDGTVDAFVQRLHPDDRESTLAVMEQATRSGSDFQLQHRVVWPDGSIHWLSGAGRVLLGSQGEAIRGVGISLDVTERRTLEEQYQQAQKMEAIGRLAGGVAHDFNNLLTAILGYCDLLLSDLSPGDPRHADVMEIHKAGVRAAGLTRQLLAFSRKQIIEPTLLDLNTIVGDVRRMLARLIGEDVRVDLGLWKDPTLVLADRGQIEQVILNLAVNARDAMPHGGRLTIETANVELDDNYASTHFAIKPGRYVALIVTDTGSGMSPEIQKRLFEPFFTTKAPGKGTGLGLATIHGIITRAGGSVHVYSEVGKGTSFKVYLPRADGEAMPEAAESAPSLLLGSQTVLLVEDSESLRALTTRLLQRLGYTVLPAATADDAVALFERHPSIDLLLTDVVMPDKSGPELAKQLQIRYPQLRVIFMSGYTEETMVHHGVVNHGIAFLNKPFTTETLGRKLREVLAHPA